MNARRVVVAPDGTPWILTADYGIARREPDDTWERLPGFATDLAIGPKGQVWAIGSPIDALSKSQFLMRFDGGHWEQVDKLASAVAVDSSGQPWIIDERHRVLCRRSDGTWVDRGGLFSDLAIGPADEVWALGWVSDAAGGDAPIMRLTDSGWVAIDGAAARITVDPDGMPWVINKEHACFRRNRDGCWVDLPYPALDVDVGSQGKIWSIDAPAAGHAAGEIRERGHTSFCILPFKELTIFPNGRVVPCCQFEGSLSTPDGQPLSMYGQSFNEIWNSEDLRSIREDMLNGKRVSACRSCYYVEEQANRSLRDISNHNWEAGWLNSPLTSFAELKNQTEKLQYELPTPAYIELGLGNLCNLKCRMCDGGASSRINRDPIHAKWNGADRELELIPHNHHWWEQEKIVGDILRHPEQIDTLFFIGGEPGIIKEVHVIMKRLVDAGVAHQITLWLSTNATTTNQPWCDLVGHFKELVLHVSMDGRGKVYEYIRFPAKWQAITRNIETLRHLPKTRMKGALTLQAYNALDIVDLCRYLDGIGAPFSFNVFHSPPYLTPRVMPPKARRIASQRIKSYATTDCAPEQRDEMLALAVGLDHLADEWDQELVRQFLSFTEELDVSREQRFADACPELHGYIREAGGGS
jgi:MoaA/NifB/PqqE/SkfB family radical SAM enzyme